MIDRLRDVLAAATSGDAPDARELSEMLWLACHLTPAEQDAPATPLPPPETSGPDEPAPGPVPGPVPDDPAPAHPPEPRSALHPRPAPGAPPPTGTAAEVLVPTAPMLPDPLGVQRALRPVKRRVPSRHRRELDEDATAARIADTRLWTPVLTPAPERWLTLTLIVDTGPTMRLWRPLARELTEVLQRQGAFQNVNVAYLDASGRVSAAPGAPPRSPATLLDASGRHAALLLSDCSGPHWWNGRAAPAVRHWARSGPTAILQPLPERLWRRTAAPTTPGLAVLPRPGGPNTGLRFTPLDGAAPPGLPVPVLEIAPRWFGAWARLVSGSGPQPAAIAALPSSPRDAPAPAAPDTPVADRVRRFLDTASDEASELAAHVAVSVPSLPVMRLIQHGVLGRSDPGRLAEVLLSGLLRPLDDVRYEFVPGAREALLDTLPRPEAQHTRRVLEAVSAEIERRAGTTAETFRALLATSDGPVTLTADTDHFALLPATTLPTPPAPTSAPTAVPASAPSDEITSKSKVVGFPAGLRERYEPIRTLADRARRPVYLAKPIGPTADPAPLLAIRVYRGSRLDLRALTALSERGRDSLFPRIYDSGEEDDDGLLAWIAYEYCPLGSLHDVMHGDRPPNSHSELRQIVTSIAISLHFWHNEIGLPLPNLAPGNLLVRSRDPYAMVIGDFSGALIEAGHRPWNASPPLERRRNEPAAWWTLGVIAYELLLGRTPYEGMSRDEALQAQRTGRVPMLETVDDPEWRRLITGLLTADVNERWGYDEVMEWASTARPTAPQPPRFSAADDVLELNGAGQGAAFTNAWRLPISMHRTPGIGHDPDGDAFPAPSLDLVEGNSGLVVGDIAARRHILRVIALALAAKYPPSQMRFAFAGLGEHPLGEAFPALPHVLYSDEELLGRPSALQHFIDFLLGELDTRRRHASPEDLPHLVVMADVSLTFPSSKREVGETLLQLAQRGIALGVHIVLASSTVESSTIWNRFLPLLDWRIVTNRLPPAVLQSVMGRASLSLPEGDAYLVVTGGAPHRFTPADLPPESTITAFARQAADWARTAVPPPAEERIRQIDRFLDRVRDSTERATFEAFQGLVQLEIRTIETGEADAPRHVVFEGPYRTEMRDVARLYGQVLAEIGALQHGHVTGLPSTMPLGDEAGDPPATVRGFPPPSSGVLLVRAGDLFSPTAEELITPAVRMVTEIVEQGTDPVIVLCTEDFRSAFAHQAPELIGHFKRSIDFSFVRFRSSSEPDPRTTPSTDAPDLPDVVRAAELPDVPGRRIPIGIAAGTREPVLLDLEADRHLLICGPSDTGRAALVRLLIGEIAARHPGRERVIHLLDPNGRLHGFAAGLERDVLGRYGRTPEEIAEIMGAVMGDIALRRQTGHGIDVYLVMTGRVPLTANDPLPGLLHSLGQSRNNGLHLILNQHESPQHFSPDPVVQQLHASGAPAVLTGYSGREARLWGVPEPAGEPGPRGRATFSRRGRHQLMQIAEPG